jgi:hypothetical protein
MQTISETFWAELRQKYFKQYSTPNVALVGVSNILDTAILFAVGAC